MSNIEEYKTKVENLEDENYILNDMLEIKNEEIKSILIEYIIDRERIKGVLNNLRKLNDKDIPYFEGELSIINKTISRLEKIVK